MSSGGVAVVQTFFSEDLSEEIQIGGRTCRQGENGTRKHILLAEDLEKWKDGKTTSREKGAPFITMEEIDRLIKSSDKDALYHTLNKRRSEWHEQKSMQRTTGVEKAQAWHDTSVNLQKGLFERTTCARTD